MPGDTPDPNSQRPLLHRLAWFAALWAAGVAALALIAYALRSVLL